MYESLLKMWCDSLLELQITDKKQKQLYGGILCPACARVHGRCGDAVYPLMYMADKTGEEKYLEGAKRLFDWSETMVRLDNAYNNDTNSDWKGITVFAAIQLGEALYYHGHLLDEETKEKWQRRFAASTEYLYQHIDQIGGNINYPVTCSAAMAWGAKLLKEEKYSKKARELAWYGLEHLSEEGLLYGEGKNWDAVSEKGCRPVDLGYNVEESLAGLVQYALLEQDEEALKKVEKAMMPHLEFMLPDGAWDNSWGTRNNKWSYWGSRTSDGCQAGYGLLADRVPEFAEAVYRNTKLLEECTHDGILHGGPMYHTAGAAPCIHHTFCHAKALAAFLNHGAKAENQENTGKRADTILPRDRVQGVKYFPSIHVHLLSKGTWRATVSDYDVEYSCEGHGTGGAITMLWHQNVGAVLVGTMSHYELIEPNNMQLVPQAEIQCLTPRLEYEERGIFYRSINDKAAQIECRQGENICLTAKGILRNAIQQGSIPYEVEYQMEDAVFAVSGKTCAEKGRFWIPMILSSEEEWERISEACVRLYRKNTMIEVSASHPLKLENGYRERIFNPVGGFEALPLYIDVIPGRQFEVRIEAME